MEKVAFGPRRLGHVNLYVSDLEASLSFYERHCGLARVRMESAISAGFLSNGNTHHDLGLIEISRGQDRHGRDGHVQIQSTRGQHPGLNHLGWEMENQAALVAAYERMRTAGIAPHALYDHIISHAVYVSDPDGNVHEFYADSMKDWESVFNLDHDDLVTSRWDPLSSERSTTPNYNPAPSLRRPAPSEMPTRHVTGASLATRRYDEMMHFMQEVAGFRLLAETASPSRSAVFGGTTGRPDLRLTEVGAGQQTGFRMFSLMADPVGFSRHLAEAPVLATARRVVHDDREAVVLADPDGFLVELYASRDGTFLEPLALAHTG